MNALSTDLYELTMAAGYFAAGKTSEVATFEMFVRTLPPGRDWLVFAGLEQAVDYLCNLRFAADELAWLRTLPQFSQCPQEFWQYLSTLRFTGDIFAPAEGTPMLAHEPLLTVRAPLIEAQIVETYLLATIGYQTMIATKASLMVDAAQGRAVVEFGTRRAHSPAAGVLAGRAAYIGGCVGTSNTLAGFRYGIPVFGTAAHSWILAFDDEREAYSRLQQLLGDRCTYLIDTNDTLEGARIAASLGAPLWGVRLDSGDLVVLARKVRRIFDEAGLPGAKIMASNELDEERIRHLIAQGAPIDAFGVGSRLATSSDAPSLGVVYKLVEIERDGNRHYAAKLSPDKRSLAGAKQVFRYADQDVIGLATECRPLPGDCTALLMPALIDGQPLPESLQGAHAARARYAELKPSGPRQVRYSDELLRLQH